MPGNGSACLVTLGSLTESMAVEIQSFLRADNVIIDLDAGCKREALRLLSAHAGELLGLNQSILLDRLYDREQLGTTGIGEGIAVPHARTELAEMHGILARLRQPVDFDAVDDRPVDLVFMLLAPERADADHLKALSRIARLMRDQSVRNAMRGASDSDSLFSIALGKTDAEAA